MGKWTWGGQACSVIRPVLCSTGHRAMQYKFCNSSSQWARGFCSTLKTQMHIPPPSLLNLLERVAYHVVLVGFSKG